jgi:hypothetical protein
MSELWDSRRSVRTWTRKLRKVQLWKPLPGDNRRRYSRMRRLDTCCSELQYVCELAMALWLFVVTFCKCSINPITNPTPAYRHSYTWQYQEIVSIYRMLVYITTLSQFNKSYGVKWGKRLLLVNKKEWEWKRSWVILIYCPTIHLKELRKTKKNVSRHNRPLGQCPVEFKPRTSGIRCRVNIHYIAMFVALQCLRHSIFRLLEYSYTLLNDIHSSETFGSSENG